MKLSIVIGSYNRLELLKKCIQSVFEQTQTSLKLYVTDAGSTDGAIEYLQSVASEQLIPILVGKKLGQAKAYNDVFAQIETPYVCWLSDDNEVVNHGLDIALQILEENPRMGMAALKTKDVQGPFVAAPYIGGVSQIGVLNVNQGMLRTSALKQVGGFSEVFRDYGIDPDLTAKILFSGYEVAYTKVVALHHYRDWGADEVLSQMRSKQVAYQKLYLDKYQAFKGGDWFWRFKQLSWLFARRGLGLQRRMNSHRRLFGLTVRDLQNILTSRYISLLDPLQTRRKAYHLVQRCPARQLPAQLPAEPTINPEVAMSR